MKFMVIQRRIFFFLIFIFAVSAGNPLAQPSLVKDYSFVMEVPSILAMESSPAHLYILSDTEGMIVFRTQPDSLQWLYSSTGMERRGNIMTADIRFAYLFGLSRRLTVLEPTSVLGVYSSTILPEKPLDTGRMGNFLYVAMGTKGLGKLSLSSPSSVDSTVTLVERGRLRNEKIIDIEVSPNQLFALSSREKLFVFNKDEEGIQLSEELTVSKKLDRIYIIGEVLLGSDDSGNIYEIGRSGNLAGMGSIGEPIQKIESWKEWLIIKGSSDRIWTSYRNRAPVLWKKDRDAGNYFTISKDQFWFSEYGQISRIKVADQDTTTSGPAQNRPQSVTDELNLQSIEDVSVPFPRPVLVPIILEGNFPIDQVKFAYQSNIRDARIKGNGFYWQPTASNVGSHTFRIIATASDGQVDSTSFNVEVRSFNAPPRFSPIRPITIPVGESFTLPIRAIDPDGMNRDLIRYLGSDLPEGAQIDEKTGKFTWTPTARQIGENQFQVIATDQYGAAASIDITIRVIEVSQADETQN